MTRPVEENITGASLGGSDGAQNRTYTLANTTLYGTIVIVTINGVGQHQGSGKDFTLASGVLTFLNVIFDNQIITLNYFITDETEGDDIDYATVQNVLDELDGKTTSDISEARVTSAIQRAEALIDLKTNTSFKQITVTDEVHTVDRYSIETSPAYLDTINPSYSNRTDYWGGGTQNRVKVNYAPIVSITSLSINSAGYTSADSWTVLTQQTGSSGDYLIADANAGLIDFVSDYPKLGYRSWKITYVYGYDRDSTNRRVIAILGAVRRLTILLASKQIITTKSTGAMFDSTRDVKIGAIEIKAGAMSGRVYLNSIEPEITELWKQIGELIVEVI